MEGKNLRISNAVLVAGLRRQAKATPPDVLMVRLSFLSLKRADVNAAKYARVPERVMEILINIRREGNRLLISVSDTGKGMDERVLECLNKGELYVDRDG